MAEKEKITVRFDPRTVRRADQWIAEANCRSRNEFIEKAVNYYVDRLMAEDADSLLRSISIATNRGEAQRSGFAAKRKKEGANMQFSRALQCGNGMERASFDARRAESVKNVNRTNGKISFENRMRDAYDEYAEDDDEWRG